MSTSTKQGNKEPYEMGFLLAPRVPQGLASVVESLTREVLRKRPEDIYVFAARHFEKLLTLREEYEIVDKKKSNKEYDKLTNAIKKRNNDSKELKKSKRTVKDINDGDDDDDDDDGSGGCWSLNETARVLEKHRNIFGGNKNRITTDEIRALANETNLKLLSSKTKHGKRKTSDNSNQYSKDNKDKSQINRHSKTLKVISQIPTALTRNTATKDIKMELRKNRLSDRSRKSSSSNKTESIENFQQNDQSILNKMINRRSESVERYSNRSSRSRKRKDHLTELVSNRKELSKTRSMDHVKEYVARNFGTTRNIDDQSDTSYIDQVQNVIDQNMPIIKDKIDELKYDLGSKKSKRSYLNNEIILKKRESRPNTSESDTRSNDDRDKCLNKRSSSADSTDFRKQQRNENDDDTLENRLINTQNILEGISSKCYNKSETNNHRSKSNNSQHSNEPNNKYFISEDNSKIVLPAVRPTSSKNSINHCKNDSNDLILPPISPDTSKIFKKKDDLTLPVLSTINVVDNSLRSEEKGNNNQLINDENDDNNLGHEILQLSTSIKEDLSSTRKMLANVTDVLNTPNTSSNDTNQIIDDNIVSNIDENNLNEVLGEEVFKIDENESEEIFHDSLNVTPDIIDIPPSPDSLEPVTENRQLSKIVEEIVLKTNVDKVSLDSLDDSIDKHETKDSIIVEKSDNAMIVQSEEPVNEEIIEIIKVSSDLDHSNETSMRNTSNSNDDYVNKNNKSDELNISQFGLTNDDNSTEQIKNVQSEDEMTVKKIDKIVDDDENIINEEEKSSLSFKEEKLNDHSLEISLLKEVPYSYILTEGSPVEIPDFITTVIIPERSPSTPEFNLETNNEEEEEEEEEIKSELREERKRRAVESFGEYIKPEQMECSTVDIDFIRGIKAGHEEVAIIRQDLDGIKEEEEEYDEEKQMKLIDDVENKNQVETNNDRSSLLEHISETEENEITDDNCKNDSNDKKMIEILDKEIVSSNNRMNNDKEEMNDNGIEQFLEGEESTETVDVSSESTNEVKETTITDRSTDSLSLDPARPIVPELNLDSLRDITVSSFKMNDADETVSLSEQTLSGKNHLEDNVVKLKNDDQKDDTTSPIEMISMDDKVIDDTNESSLIIHLDKEETSKDEGSILSDEIIQNENERLVISKEIQIQFENTADLDTEEEIAKELIEIDRNENREYLVKDISVVSKDNLGDKSCETLDTNDETKDCVILTTVEDENRSIDVKQDDNDSSDNIISKDNLEDESREILDLNDETKDQKILTVVEDENVKSIDVKQDDNDSSDNTISKDNLEDKYGEILDSNDKMKDQEIVTVVEDENRSIDVKQDDNDSSKNIISEDNLEDKSGEILDSNDEMKDQEIVTIVEEENIKSIDLKQDDNDSFDINKISDKSIENLEDIKNVKDEEEMISEKIESTSSNDEKKKDDQSDASLENNLKSETCVMALDEIEGKENDTKLDEKNEYHIYVSDLKPNVSQENDDDNDNDDNDNDDNDDSSKSSSMTFHSAVTKIQAGIRGFLTRKKLQENYPHSSTLDSIPSIQETVAEEPLLADVKSVTEEVANSLIKSALSSAMRSENITTVDDKEKLLMTKIVSMPMKHRQCLRREDAIQRNTLSTENAFTSCGVQHTGEFHDCLPLPVLESSIEINKSNVLSTNKNDKNKNLEEEEQEEEEEELIDENKSEKCTKDDDESNEHNNDDDDDNEIIENIHCNSSILEKDLNNLLFSSSCLNPKDYLTKILVSQVDTPIVLGLVDISPNSALGTNSNIIFESNSNLNVNEDKILSIKDDATLENRYLNFITSVEDNESSNLVKTLKEYKDHSNEHSMPSLREPLALPGTPEGVLIEELSSLDSTTISKLQDVSLNPINLDSTTMDRESEMKSIDSNNSIELLDKSDDVDVKTPITAKYENKIENMEEVIKNDDEQLLVDENKVSSSDKKNENKETWSDVKDENKESSSDKIDENKELSSDKIDENKESSSDNKSKTVDDTSNTKEKSEDDKT
ncbi:hypothetical protein M0802_008678 [Mischocyttarus mexicanus]|nr:hypothetical protein M0802_008678 [Mischocyttarus mexicanus]